MAKHVDVEVHGLDELFRFLVVGHDRANEGVWNLLDDLAKRGEHYIKLYAPVYTGDILRHVGRTVPHPSVGAGGAELEAATGVRHGAAHLFAVHGGSGLYKLGGLGASRLVPGGRGGGPITPNKPGGVLTFQKRGEVRKFRPRVSGQKANPFVYYAYQQLLPYARGRVHRMLRDMDTRS
jgi:hypothetical protein